MKQLTQKGKSLTASATGVQTISNKFTAVVSNVVQCLDESYPVEHHGRHLEFHYFLVCGEQLTQKGKSLTASATGVQTISNKFTAVVSNVVQCLDESYPVEHYGRHLEFHSFLVCGEAAHTKREKLDSFSDSGSNYFTARL